TFLAIRFSCRVRPFSRFSSRGPTHCRSIRLLRGGIQKKILWPVLRTMIDARDLNGILLDLVNDNVGRKNQFAPSGSCVQGGRGGEIGATLRNRHRWLSRHPERRRD